MTQQFEYRVEYFKDHYAGASGHTPPTLADFLMDNGKNGWRLVQMLPHGEQTFLVVFERKRRVE